MAYSISAPPTDLLYDSLDELYTAINTYAKEHGYTIIKKRTKANGKRGLFRYTFKCAKGKKRVSESYSYRDSSTAKCDCLFAAYAKASNEG